MTRDDLDKIEVRIRRRWPIIEAKANLPRPQTADERHRATLRARRHAAREHVADITLKLLFFVVAVGGLILGLVAIVEGKL